MFYRKFDGLSRRDFLYCETRETRIEPTATKSRSDRDTSDRPVVNDPDSFHGSIEHRSTKVHTRSPCFHVHAVSIFQD